MNSHVYKTRLDGYMVLPVTLQKSADSRAFDDPVEEMERWYTETSVIPPHGGVSKTDAPEPMTPDELMAHVHRLGVAGRLQAIMFDVSAHHHVFHEVHTEAKTLDKQYSHELLVLYGVYITTKQTNWRRPLFNWQDTNVVRTAWTVLHLLDGRTPADVYLARLVDYLGVRYDTCENHRLLIDVLYHPDLRHWLDPTVSLCLRAEYGETGDTTLDASGFRDPRTLGGLHAQFDPARRIHKLYLRYQRAASTTTVCCDLATKTLTTLCV